MTLSLLFFLRNDHKRYVVGQDQEFWTDMLKLNFKEQYIQYNYTLFIRAIIWNQKNSMITG